MSIAYRALTVLAAGSVVVGTSAAATSKIVLPSASRVSLVAAVQVSSSRMTGHYGAACVAGAATAAGATAAATTQQATGPGCLLPVLGAPPPVIPAPPAIPDSSVASGGLGVLPVLLGVVAIAGAIALLARGGGDDADTVSPG